MSSFQRITFVFAVGLAIIAASGCCVLSPCGPAGCGIGPRPLGHVGCADAGCDSPGCGTQQASCDCGVPACHGRFFGLGCIARLFDISRYGCGGCGAPASAGCGEVYYHDWINNPPTPDPCDCSGNFTGSACTSCSSGGGCECGHAPGTAIVEPSCGADAPCGLDGCDSCGGVVSLGSAVAAPIGAVAQATHVGHGGRGLVQVPGRILYKAWTGVGGSLRQMRQGILPHSGTCNAFTGPCGSCVGCQTGATTLGHQVVVADAPATLSTPLVQTSATRSGRVPHLVRSGRPSPKRHPHPVVAQRNVQGMVR